MKARQVLKLYAKGRRDFQGQNLRGQSFKNQNLSGADFSYADIRGANFRGAVLKNTKFRGAKAGLHRVGATVWVTLLWLLSVVAGLGWVLAGYGLLLVFNLSSPEDTLVLWIALISGAAFLALALRRGIGASLKAVGTALAVAGLGVTVGAIAGLAGVATVAGAFAVAGAFVGFTGALAFVLAVAFAVATTVARSVAVTFSLARVAAVAMISGAIALYISGPFASGAIAVASGLTLLFDAIGRRAVRGDPQYTRIRNTATLLAATGGTGFQGANLTDADFTNAVLQDVDLQWAILTRTRWLNAKGLDSVRPGTSYLADPRVRSLVGTGRGAGENFDGADLRGVNLRGANLAETSFIGTDLNLADLRGANLLGAKLVRTRLDRADLSGAILTGACVEDWGITLKTKLRDVRCDYIFMRFPGEGSPDRNPRRQPPDWNQNFEAGEFVGFILAWVRDRWYQNLYHSLLQKANITGEVPPPPPADTIDLDRQAEAIAALEHIIEAVEPPHPLTRTSEQMQFAATVIRELETDPQNPDWIESLRAIDPDRLLGVLESPAAIFIVTAIRHWESPPVSPQDGGGRESGVGHRDALE